MLTISYITAACIAFAISFEAMCCMQNTFRKKSSAVDILKPIRKQDSDISRELHQVLPQNDINQLNKRLNTLNEDISWIKSTLKLVCDQLIGADHSPFENDIQPESE